MSFCVFSNSFNKKGEDFLLLSQAVTASIKDLTGLYRRTLFSPARSIKTLEIYQVSVNFKLLKLDDGSVVDLKAVPDCDFAFSVVFLHFCSQ